MINCANLGISGSISSRTTSISVELSQARFFSASTRSFYTGIFRLTVGVALGTRRPFSSESHREPAAKSTGSGEQRRPRQKGRLSPRTNLHIPQTGCACALKVYMCRGLISFRTCSAGSAKGLCRAPSYPLASASASVFNQLCYSILACWARRTRVCTYVCAYVYVYALGHVRATSVERQIPCIWR